MIINNIEYRVIGIMGDRVYLQRMTPITDKWTMWGNKIGRKIRFNAYDGHYIDLDSCHRISLSKLVEEWQLMSDVNKFNNK